MATFDSTSGYRRLDSWILASIVQFATYRFCEKFLTRKLDPTGRQYDQMTQAARSGKVNIVEGSARSATSKETEMKLTDVARASLNELVSDYEDWLLRQGLVPWHKNSEEAKAVFAVWLNKPDYKDDWVYESCVHLLKQQSRFDKWLHSDDSVTVANCLIILIRRSIKMLAGQLQTQVETFEQKGGFREQLTQMRTAAKAKNENAPACPICGKPMTLRKATTGKNAGNKFWGCTGYPECMGIKNIDKLDSNK
ncbi:MAG: four helix bundle suffix domain-containing protein [Prevotellaceae bacterium]|jgi:four helix bundle suffix protein|nr:four helix bundle suffix domain-containing protein [Prevotellaceae bacterium]